MRNSQCLLAAFALAATSANAAELITNGDFSAGNTGFTTTYNYQVDTASQGLYFLDTNAHNQCSCWVDLADHTSGTGKYLQGDGAPTGLDFFDETVAVVANTDYTLSYWATQLGGGPQATLSAQINGTAVGSSFTPGGTAWENFTVTFNSGAATSLAFGLRDLATGHSYNDFGVDDISLTGPLGVAAVPEPATWALLLSGFAMTGVAVRRRARGSVAA